MLVFQEVAFARDGRTLFEGLSFALKAGDCTALSGPSGSGKTSILRLVMGFEKPMAGRILVDGREVDAKSIRGLRRSMAFAPQNFPAMEPAARVLNAIMGFRANRAAAPDAAAIPHMLRDLGLPRDPDFLNRPANELSAGERSRLGLAIALLLERPLLLLDEPTANLDAKTRELVIQRLMQTKDRSLLIATHDPALLEQCDERIVLGNNTGGDANE